MSFNKQELENYCKYILKAERIRNRLLVLCEGKKQKEQIRVSKSPQSYQEKNATPDSSFYKKCIPDSWFTFNLIPEFFNCGNCDDVIRIYLTLSEILNQDVEKQYVHPKKIFAIVDLDNQIRKINNYQFKTTEDIFFNLYETTKINTVNVELNHTIWVTGLVHKEAYFLVPELQQFFDKYHIQFFYKGSKLSLEEIYLAMYLEMDQDKNLTTNLEVVRPRIKHCIGLDFDDVEQLKSNWITQFQNATDEQRKRELILSLLTVINVKEQYWKNIKPERGLNAYQHKEQLALTIARNFYAKQTDDKAAAKYHIPYFFKMLRKFACDR